MKIEHRIAFFSREDNVLSLCGRLITFFSIESCYVMVYKAKIDIQFAEKYWLYKTWPKEILNHSSHHAVNWPFLSMKFINNGNRNWIIKHTRTNAILHETCSRGWGVYYVCSAWTTHYTFYRRLWDGGCDALLVIWSAHHVVSMITIFYNKNILESGQFKADFERNINSC